MKNVALICHRFDTKGFAAFPRGCHQPESPDTQDFSALHHRIYHVAPFGTGVRCVPSASDRCASHSAVRAKLKNSCEISHFSDYNRHSRHNLFDKYAKTQKKQPQKNFFPVGDTAIDTKTFGKRSKNSQISCALHTFAGVMELADIRDLKSLGVKSVPVRARSPAPSEVPKIVAV